MSRRSCRAVCRRPFVAAIGTALAAAVLAPVLAGATPSATPSSTASSTASTSPSASSTGSSTAPAPDPAVVAAAQEAALRAAKHVAELVHGVAAAQRQAAGATKAAATVQAQFDAQVLAQRTATQTAALATANARTAQAAYQLEHRDFVALVVAGYESGDNGTGAVNAFDSLLSATSPRDLLVADQDRHLLADRQAIVVSQDRVASLVNQAAQTRAQAALADARQATARLTALRDSSRAAADKASTTLDVLRRELTAAQVTQAQADSVLSGFLGGWTVADPARAAALDRAYLDKAKKWTGKITSPAQLAVRRAILQIGTPYAWAGGNASGPTQGVCTGGGAENDCHVIGLDCSGLALYAWAPFRSLPHLASAQYTAAGRLHPTVTDLKAGDLVFWSSDGTVAGIHHVALYIGDGMVVQAPQSGDIVRVTPLGSVSSDFFGATRPLS